VNNQHNQAAGRTWKRTTALGVLFLALFGMVNAQSAKPNFTGEWEMDSVKSDFGAFPKPTTITRTIVQKDPELAVSTTQRGANGEQTAHAVYRTDGVDTTNQFNSGPGTSHAFWDGNTLVIRTGMKGRNNLEVELQERWTLSSDGKTLTTASHIETSQGSTDLTLVCRRVK
jgi:hypothetical protein